MIKFVSKEPVDLHVMRTVHVPISNFVLTGFVLKKFNACLMMTVLMMSNVQLVEMESHNVLTYVKNTLAVGSQTV